MNQRKVLSGEKVTGGIGIGRLYYIDRDFVSIPHLSLDDKKDLLENEVKRFLDAVSFLENELSKFQQDQKIDAETRSILEAHRMMLTDPILSQYVQKEIREHRINAEWAVLNVFQRLADMLSGSGNNYYIKAKVADLDIVRDKLVSELLGEKEDTSFADALPEEDFVICSSTLTVSELNILSKNPFVKGIVLEAPGGVSHLTVVLRVLEIPSVMGIPSLISELDFGDIIIVDGVKGEVILRPERQEVKEYIRKKHKFEQYFARFLQDVEKPANSKDGFKMGVGGNIDQAGEVDLVKKYGGEFIGLFRTELMFLDRKDIPTEEEHAELYYQTLHQALPMRATIRILDFGEDKEGNIIHKGFMGMRGIRLCKERPDVFIPQIRGLIRAAELGNLNILLPFVSAVHEVDDFKEVLYREARSMGLGKNLDTVKIGAMIEVPAAVFISEQLASEVDFFSVGTNDLIQYMMAVERKDEGSSEFFSHYSPPIVRVLFQLSHVARERNKYISICGEMAADRYFPLVFLAMGINSLSMTPTSIPIIKKIIKNGYKEEGDYLLKKIVMATDKYEVKNILETFMTDKYPHIFSKEWNNS